MIDQLPSPKQPNSDRTEVNASALVRRSSGKIQVVETTGMLTENDRHIVSFTEGGDRYLKAVEAVSLGEAEQADLAQELAETLPNYEQRIGSEVLRVVGVVEPEAAKDQPEHETSEALADFEHEVKNAVAELNELCSLVESYDRSMAKCDDLRYMFDNLLRNKQSPDRGNLEFAITDLRYLQKSTEETIRHHKTRFFEVRHRVGLAFEAVKREHSDEVQVMAAAEGERGRYESGASSVEGYLYELSTQNDELWHISKELRELVEREPGYSEDTGRVMGRIVEDIERQLGKAGSLNETRRHLMLNVLK